MTRLVEGELKDRELFMATCIAMTWWLGDDMESASRAPYFLEANLQLLSAQSCWANGRHHGDCTKDSITCCRCLVEGWVDEGKGIIEISDERRTAVARQILNSSKGQHQATQVDSGGSC